MSCTSAHGDCQISALNGCFCVVCTAESGSCHCTVSALWWMVMGHQSVTPKYSVEEAFVYKDVLMLMKDYYYKIIMWKN